MALFRQSASAAQGSLIIIYGDENYDGPAYGRSSSVTRAPDNDTMTAFHLAQGRSVIFYIDVDYQYELFRCPSVAYPDNDCARVRPEHNDKMSSFRLYEDDSFQRQI